MATLPLPNTPRAHGRTAALNASSVQQLTPEHALASSPLLKDNDFTPMRRNPNRSSVASSARISRDLEELRQEISGLRQDPSVQDTGTPNTQRNSFNPYSESEAEGDVEASQRKNSDGYSGLSDKADTILENAKRKLDLLEGNLKGARYSLHAPTQMKVEPEPRAASSASMRLATRASPNGTGETLRAVQHGYSNWRVPRGQILPVKTDHTHSRGFSETSLPQSNDVTINRSQSLKYASTREMPGRPLHRPSSDQEPYLGAVEEEETMPSTRQTQRPISALRLGHTKSPSITKELRSQADELRTRLAFLQNRARDDSAKRNSHRLSGSSASEDGTFYDQVQALEQSLKRQEKVIAQLETAEHTKNDQSHDPREEWQQVLNRSKTPSYSDDVDDDLNDDNDGYEDNDDDDDTYEEEDDDFESVLELPDYENEDENMGGAHEDRVDAFDYEHFILHSGMGSYGNIIAGTQSSSSSASSVSTERGGNVQESANWTGLHERNESVASFETARSRTAGTGGYESGSDKDESEVADAPEGSFQGVSNQRNSHDGPTTPREGRDSALGEEDISTPTVASYPPLKNPNLHYNRRPASVIFSALTSTESAASWMMLSEDDKALLSSLSENLRNAAIHMLQDDQHSSNFWRARLEEARQLLGG